MGLKETGEACKFRVSDTNYFSSLPEECIFLILSKTSPRDLCRLSVVSSAFRSASESDVLWENFLPLDLPETTVSISSLFASKKDLFFHLCRHHYPALVDYGSKV
ncbi:hypothetical protein TIFTF001_031583 [Ficus carica]|uniref:F-box domain-containing protein n=1 Tax=Ficus carica TaxID=3494 RepID=A0AA88DVK4_FICCA|nr:hypothetical protein TIFTF001_031583 [Ficus carica]